MYNNQWHQNNDAYTGVKTTDHNDLVTRFL